MGLLRCGAGDEQDFAVGLTGFEVAVGLTGPVEREGDVYAHLKLAVGDPAEEVSGAPEQLVAAGDVVTERGAGQEERASGAEHLGIERRDGSAGLAEEHEVAAGVEAVEAAIEGGPADRVVDDVDAFVVGEVARLGDEILLGVEDDVVGAGLAGELCLGFGADRANDAGAALLG